MKMLIAIPVMGQYEIGRISLYCFDQLVSQDTDFYIIDNTEGNSLWGHWYADREPAERWQYTRFYHNRGLIKSCQKAYEVALKGGYDILCLTHNDVWVYSGNWDHSVLHFFHEIPKLGGIGLFGSKGCGREGHRLDTFGSLIEMSGHGRKIVKDYEPATTFDGFFMTFSMEMLKAAKHPCSQCKEGGIAEHRDYVETCSICHGAGYYSGFDQRYQWHHMYDLDASLTSLKLGYKNIVLNLPCHHLSGLTANNDAKATSGPDIHQANSKLFLEKWVPDLGVSVDEDFNYTWRQG